MGQKASRVSSKAGSHKKEEKASRVSSKAGNSLVPGDLGGRLSVDANVQLHSLLCLCRHVCHVPGINEGHKVSLLCHLWTRGVARFGSSCLVHSDDSELVLMALGKLLQHNFVLLLCHLWTRGVARFGS